MKGRFGNASEDWAMDNFIPHKRVLTVLPDSWVPGSPNPKLDARPVFPSCKSLKEIPDVLTFIVHGPHVNQQQ